MRFFISSDYVESKVCVRESLVNIIYKIFPFTVCCATSFLQQDSKFQITEKLIFHTKAKVYLS